jgi:site-specific DNA recombinase
VSVPHDRGPDPGGDIPSIRNGPSQSLRRPSKSGYVRAYGYYRWGGADGYRFGGQRVCSNKQVRMEILDQAVWEDGCVLLAHPERIEQESDRRLNREPPGETQEAKQRAGLIQRVKRGIGRLIDADEEGLLAKSEFEPRIRGAREHLSRLEAEAVADAERQVQTQELRLVLGRLEEFAQRVREGRADSDQEARRELICALVKRVEVDEAGVRIVYKVAPPPVEEGPGRGSLQDYGRRHQGLRWARIA